MRALLVDVLAAAVETSPSATRYGALAGIAAGTVLFLVFVAVKMRARIACDESCCAAADPAAAERERVLHLAATLYQAAAADPNFACSPAVGDWRPPPSPYTCPTLSPPEPRAAPPLARAPSAASEVARSPWSRSSPAASPTTSQRLSSPRPPRQSVSELIREWTSFGSRGNREARAVAAAAAVAEQAAAEREADIAALEAGLACQPSVAAETRALTWAQLGVSPGASRRTSENSTHGGGRRAPLPPLPPRPPAGAEVHTNPVFAANDWAAPAASAADAGSFSLRRVLSRSRLSFPANFADPEPAATAAMAAASAAPAADEGPREGSSHGHYQRRHSGLHAAGGGMTSRLSDQSLLHLGRINE